MLRDGKRKSQRIQEARASSPPETLELPAMVICNPDGSSSWHTIQVKPAPSVPAPSVPEDSTWTSLKVLPHKSDSEPSESDSEASPKNSPIQKRKAIIFDGTEFSISPKKSKRKGKDDGPKKADEPTAAAEDLVSQVQVAMEKLHECSVLLKSLKEDANILSRNQTKLEWQLNRVKGIAEKVVKEIAEKVTK